ncbi:uncharacterized protein (DUF58 family) [Paenibacillus phyllosphaerae]|uniref:Uncharacterized protein (DUF58 family) n=1 Tax=Paenibacillus phyllosphaerae TaxID=274593 RepID=A0A7W5FPU4_9BACL|nr:DUF58 domain-containing protein [Paenibacillus phyllosphaerae]MBB3112588.1 uncharacterized protein (DUF58 family) [Paenibacillus phyllosphaerae]
MSMPSDRETALAGNGADAERNGAAHHVWQTDGPVVWEPNGSPAGTGKQARKARKRVGGKPDTGVPIQEPKRRSGRTEMKASASGSRQPLAAQPEARPRSRHAARLALLGFIAIAAAAVQARGGAVEWLLLGASAAAGCLVWIVPYLAVGRVEAHREFEETGLYDGGTLTVKLSIRTSLPMPFMWVTVKETLRDPGAERRQERIEATAVYIPGLRRSHAIRYSVQGVHRGEMEFGPLTVVCGDWLGMTVRSFQIACPGRVTILPDAPRGEKVKALPGALAAIRQTGAQAVAGNDLTALQPVRAVQLQPGASSETRGYIPGDPLRLISWRAMARGLGMQTRIGSPEPPGDIVLLLDVSSRAYEGDGRQFDAAVGRTALAMRYGVRSGRGVTLLAGGRKYRLRAGDEAGLRQAEHQLARLRTARSSELEWAGTELSRLPRGADVICVTGETEAEVPAALPGLSARARRTAAAKLEKRGPRKRPEGPKGDERERIARLARMVQARGGVFHLWLGVSREGATAGQQEEKWQHVLQGSGCKLSLLMLTPLYSAKPSVQIEEGSEADGYA